MLFRLAATVAAAASLVVIGDVVWTRFQWLRDLRMTKQEIKDEMKQAEGDPMVKARLRSIALNRARKRMMAQVPGQRLLGYAHVSLAFGDALDLGSTGLAREHQFGR